MVVVGVVDAVASDEDAELLFIPAATEAAAAVDVPPPTALWLLETPPPPPPPAPLDCWPAPALVAAIFFGLSGPAVDCGVPEGSTRTIIAIVLPFDNESDPNQSAGASHPPPRYEESSATGEATLLLLFGPTGSRVKASSQVVGTLIWVVTGRTGG